MKTFEKRQMFIAEAVALGESERRVAPWIYRTLWRSGIDVPPPLYCSFLQHLAITGIFAGVFWGLCMWLILWRAYPIWFTLIAASLFGIWMAAWSWFSLRRKRRNLGFCDRWCDYPKPQTKKVEQAGAGDAEEAV